MNDLITTSSRAKIEIASDRAGELVARYQRLRTLGIQLNHRLANQLSKNALREGARILGLLKGKSFVFETESESAVLMDYCIYHIVRNGRTVIDQILIDSPPEDDSVEMTLLRALQHSVYSIFEVESVVPDLGIMVRDLSSEQSTLVIDLGMSRSSDAGDIFASRLIPCGDFSMTGGAAIPMGRAPEHEREEILTGFKQALGMRDGDGIHDPAPLIKELLRKGTMRSSRFEDPFGEPIPGLDSDIDDFNAPPEPRFSTAASHVHATRRVGRNERCPCGSGKKFKHCCLNHD